MLYRFADYNIKFIKTYGVLREELELYMVSFGEPDAVFQVTMADAENEVMLSNEKAIVRTGMVASALRKIAEWLPLHNAFVLHSACFDVDGVGVAFAAHSGTGKTTHMMLWQQLLGDRITIVNGDKPIVRFFDSPLGEETGGDTNHDYPYAYGTPWNGKERLGCNMRTPLKHICFIERAEQNSCERMTDTNEAINRLFNQVYMPKDPQAAAKTIELINRLIQSVNLWKIKCNMDPSAAEISYHTIFGDL